MPGLRSRVRKICRAVSRWRTARIRPTTIASGSVCNAAHQTAPAAKANSVRLAGTAKKVVGTLLRARPISFVWPAHARIPRALAAAVPNVIARPVRFVFPASVRTHRRPVPVRTNADAGLQSAVRLTSATGLPTNVSTPTRSPAAPLRTVWGDPAARAVVPARPQGNVYPTLPVRWRRKRPIAAAAFIATTIWPVMSCPPVRRRMIARAVWPATLAPRHAKGPVPVLLLPNAAHLPLRTAIPCWPLRAAMLPLV